MPSLPPKPCCTPRCHKMATKRGKCEDHQPEPWVSSKGKTAEERGYGHKWKKIRKQALVRDGYLCQECLKAGLLTVATDVDHIINTAQGKELHWHEQSPRMVYDHAGKHIETRGVRWKSSQY